MAVAAIAQAASGSTGSSGGPSIGIISEEPSDSSLYQFAFGVPQSPALDLIGFSANKVNSQNAFRRFTFEYPQSFSNGQGAFGLDVVPGQFLPEGGVSSFYDPLSASDGKPRINRSFAAYLARLPFAVHVTVATTPGAANSDASKALPSKVAWGLSASLLPWTDPRLAAFHSIIDTSGKATPTDVSTWQDCVTSPPPGDLVEDNAGVKALETARHSAQDTLADALKARAALDEAHVAHDSAAYVAAQASVASADAAKTATDAAVTKARSEIYAASAAAKAIDLCVVKAAMAAAYAPDLKVGVGQVWAGTPGRLAEFHKPGTVLWASFHTPLWPVNYLEATNDVDNKFQVGFTVRHSWSEYIATSVKTVPFAPADITDAWGGVQYLDKNYAVFAQGGYTDRHADVAVPGYAVDRWRWLAGGTIKAPIIKGAWISLSYGDTSDDTARKNREVLLSISFSAPTADSIFNIKPPAAKGGGAGGAPVAAGGPSS